MVGNNSTLTNEQLAAAQAINSHTDANRSSDYLIALKTATKKDIPEQVINLNDQIKELKAQGKEMSMGMLAAPIKMVGQFAAQAGIKLMPQNLQKYVESLPVVGQMLSGIVGMVFSSSTKKADFNKKLDRLIKQADRLDAKLDDKKREFEKAFPEEYAKSFPDEKANIAANEPNMINTNELADQTPASPAPINNSEHSIVGDQFANNAPASNAEQAFVENEARTTADGAVAGIKVATQPNPNGAVG